MLLEPMYLLTGCNFEKDEGTYALQPCGDEDATTAIFASEALTDDADGWSQVAFGEIVFLERKGEHVSTTIRQQKRHVGKDPSWSRIDRPRNSFQQLRLNRLPQRNIATGNYDLNQRLFGLLNLHGCLLVQHFACGVDRATSNGESSNGGDERRQSHVGFSSNNWLFLIWHLGARRAHRRTNFPY